MRQGFALARDVAVFFHQGGPAMSQDQSDAETARKRQADADAARVIRMLAIKAAIFVAVPAVVAVIVVWMALG